jgi:hypothetical protein
VFDVVSSHGSVNLLSFKKPKSFDNGVDMWNKIFNSLVLLFVKIRSGHWVDKFVSEIPAHVFIDI